MERCPDRRRTLLSIGIWPWWRRRRTAAAPPGAAADPSAAIGGIPAAASSASSMPSRLGLGPSTGQHSLGDAGQAYHVPFQALGGVCGQHRDGIRRSGGPGGRIDRDPLSVNQIEECSDTGQRHPFDQVGSHREQSQHRVQRDVRPLSGPPTAERGGDQGLRQTGMHPDLPQALLGALVAGPGTGRIEHGAHPQHRAPKVLGELPPAMARRRAQPPAGPVLILHRDAPPAVVGAADGAPHRPYRRQVSRAVRAPAHRSAWPAAGRSAARSSRMSTAGAAVSAESWPETTIGIPVVANALRSGGNDAAGERTRTAIRDHGTP